MIALAETPLTRSRLATGAAIAMALLLVLLGWRVMATGWAAHLANATPEAALKWQPGQPDAALLIAEKSLREQPQASARLARAAITAAPLDARGYRLLAQSTLASGRNDEAARLYAIAAARGPRDLPSQAWLVSRELAGGNYPDALARMDLMLRVEPEVSTQLFPVLLAMAMHAPLQPTLSKLLQTVPPWRSSFVPYAIAQAPDSANVFGLIENLRHSPTGLSAQESGGWIDRLAHDHRWGSAYLVWVSTLPDVAHAHIGNVYNGSFEQEPSLQGFDWRFERIAGARIARAPVAGTDGQLALQVAFEDRRVPFQHVRQLLALGPGAYRFSGRTRLDQLSSERGLVWTLTCAEDGRVLGETEPFSGQQDWRAFQLLFTVPDVNCGGQWLTLRLPARIASEQRISGTAWFDSLQIERTPTQP